MEVEGISAGEKGVWERGRLNRACELCKTCLGSDHNKQGNLEEEHCGWRMGEQGLGSKVVA
jgi:hypothetical protein